MPSIDIYTNRFIILQLCPGSIQRYYTLDEIMFWYFYKYHGKLSLSPSPSKIGFSFQLEKEYILNTSTKGKQNLWSHHPAKSSANF